MELIEQLRERVEKVEQHDRNIEVLLRQVCNAGKEGSTIPVETLFGVVKEAFDVVRAIRSQLAEMPVVHVDAPMEERLKKIRDGYGYTLFRVVELLGLDQRTEEEELDEDGYMFDQAWVLQDQVGISYRDLRERRRKVGALIVREELPGQVVEEYLNKGSRWSENTRRGTKSVLNQLVAEFGEHPVAGIRSIDVAQSRNPHGQGRKQGAQMNKTIWLVVAVVLVSACRSPTANSQPAPGVPATSASAITSPPSSMEGINGQAHMYGTGADPAIITLGPKVGGQPGWNPYPGKTSMDFELDHGSPVLAPIDMELIGFDNRNAITRVSPDREPMMPFNDLELCFESVSPDWPGMVVCTYHLQTSPLLAAHNVDAACTEVAEWGDTFQAEGHLFYEYNDYTVEETDLSRSCQGLLGRLVERGQLIGFAGSVGDHSMAPFRFKVADGSVNALVTEGDEHLHWVQPGAFFYWKCYSPGVDFPSGVLAYPFECDGYELPSQQRNAEFKYSSGI